MVKRVLLGDHPKGDGPIKFTEPCEVSFLDVGRFSADGIFKTLVDVAEEGSDRTVRSIMLKADNFIMVKSEPAYVNYDGRLFLDVERLNTLIAAARTLCDNVETVGTHNRIDTEHIDKLRQALDGL